MFDKLIACVKAKDSAGIRQLCETDPQIVDTDAKQVELARALFETNNSEITRFILRYYLNRNMQLYDRFVINLIIHLPEHSIEYFFSSYIQVNDVNVFGWVGELVDRGQDQRLVLFLPKISPSFALFCLLVEKGKVELMRVILDAKPDAVKLLNTIGKNYSAGKLTECVTLLSLAVIKKDRAMIALLRKFGAMPIVKETKGKDEFKVNALELAVQTQDVEIEWLVPSQEELKQTLILAIEKGQIAVFQRLQAKSSIFGNRVLRKELLLTAIFYGRIEVIDCLLRDNPDLAPYDRESQLKPEPDPLLGKLLRSHHLDNMQKYSIAVRFIQLGAAVDIDDYSSGERYPLSHTCARLGNAALLEVFEKKLGHLHHLCPLGRSALHRAFMALNLETIRYLLTRGYLPFTTRYGENIFIMFRNAYPRSISMLREVALLALSLPISLDEMIPKTLRLATDGSNLSQHYSVLSYLAQNYPADTFLFRSFLEAGAKEQTIYDDVFVRIFNESSGAPKENRIKKLYIIGLLFDYSVFRKPSADHFGNENTFTLDEKKYISALIAQSKGEYAKAIVLLSSVQENAREFDYIWCRLGILHKKVGLFTTAFDYLQKAMDPSQCKSPKDPKLPATARTLFVGNELIELFHAWKVNIGSNKTTSEESAKLSACYEIIKKLPLDEITSANHFRLAEIYKKDDRLSPNEKRELCFKHYSRVIYGPKKETAARNIEELTSFEIRLTPSLRL